MKKITAIITILFCACLSFGQGTWGSYPFFYQPNIGEYHAMSAQVGAYAPVTDTALVAANDTIKITPHHDLVYIPVAVTDSATVTLKNTLGAGLYYGDEIIFDITSPTAYTVGNITFVSAFFEVATGTQRIALTENKHSRIAFRWFNGLYVEEWRNLNQTY